jgi:hypothetical protein
MEFFDKLTNLVRPKEEVFHRFDPNGRMTPHTMINLAQVREGVNPLIFLHSMSTEEPYCDKAELRWQAIVAEPDKYAGHCRVYEDVEVRVRDVNTGKQAPVTITARVVSKAGVPLLEKGTGKPIQQNEKSGLVYLDSDLYIVSPIFLDDKDKKFVLVARRGEFFSEETKKRIINTFFSEK